MARLKNCPLIADSDLKKKGRGSFDHRLKANRDIIVVKWFDNKAVHFVSSYAEVEPIHAVRHCDRSTKQHVQVSRTNIVRIYNKFMGDIDNLDLTCSLYTPILLSRRWYVDLWLHLLVTAIVNV